VSRCASTIRHSAGVAFDTIAEQYDDIFTRSLIGRAQRDSVWDILRQVFQPGQHVLELNCGTGEDALFLSRRGVSVRACDASERMIAVAAKRIAAEPRGADIQLEVCSTERIGSLRSEGFDGVLSDFSGLNCVIDLAGVAEQLAALVRPGGFLVLCLSSRICLWETAWYLVHGTPARAFRRWSGCTTASLGEVSLQVCYPTMRDMHGIFAPWFHLRGHKGIGVTVPPSYVEHLARRYPSLLRAAERADRVIAHWPGCRSVGDHTLFVFERKSA
jgi:ubiquinone/menaquinone biosynthesis C-methylase UbiE